MRSRPSDQQIYQRFLTEVEEARESASAAVADAENAYAAVRMLVPSVTDQARLYLDFCIKATAHPDEGKVERQRERQMVEEQIRRALGGGLPADWIFTEPESRAATMVEDLAAAQG